MGAIVIPNTFSSNTTAKSAQVNANFTAIAAVVNGGLDNTNLSASVIGASGASDLNSHIVDSATLQLVNNQISIATGGITNTQMGSNSVGTSNLIANSVTQAKRAALTTQFSSSCGSYGQNSGTFTDVTNLAISIATTGRPVMISLFPDGSNTGPAIIYNDTSNGQFQLIRDAASTNTIVATWEVGTSHTPCSAIAMYDPSASAGTHTYKVQAKASSGTTFCTYARLLVYEL